MCNSESENKVKIVDVETWASRLEDYLGRPVSRDPIIIENKGSGWDIKIKPTNSTRDSASPVKQ